MGIPGAELVAVACAGGAVGDRSGTDVSAGAAVATVSTSVTSGTADSFIRAATVPAMAVSSGPAGTSVGLDVERLHASPPATRAVAAKPNRIGSPDISVTVNRLAEV